MGYVQAPLPATIVRTNLKGSPLGKYCIFCNLRGNGKPQYVLALCLYQTLRDTPRCVMPKCGMEWVYYTWKGKKKKKNGSHDANGKVKCRAYCSHLQENYRKKTQVWVQ